MAIDSPIDGRLYILEELLDRHQSRISAIIQSRQNSFTSARRFIVPQVFLSAYFTRLAGFEAVFADFGTGLGILPRQLNSADQFDRFAPDLIWPKGIPAFRRIPIVARHGVDRGPMPDLDWVRACYGQSDYYFKLFGELVSSLDEPEVKEAEVICTELDLLDYDALSIFIHRNRVNAANLTYVLYEFDRRKRAELIDFLVRELHPPGALIIAEPNQELHGQGAVVEFFHNGDSSPLTLCYVSDGHYKGYVIPLDEYESFSLEYPIAYELADWELPDEVD
jgi:hypothetical protein